MAHKRYGSFLQSTDQPVRPLAVLGGAALGVAAIAISNKVTASINSAVGTAADGTPVLNTADSAFWGKSGAVKTLPDLLLDVAPALVAVGLGVGALFLDKEKAIGAALLVGSSAVGLSHSAVLLAQKYQAPGFSGYGVVIDRKAFADVVRFEKKKKAAFSEVAPQRQLPAPLPRQTPRQFDVALANGMAGYRGLAS